MKLKITFAFLSFCIVGFLTAFIYLSLFTILWKWLHLNYKIALSISFLTAVVFQFTVNRNVTFQNHEGNVVAQALKYCSLVCVNYFLSLSIVTFSVNELKVSPYVGIVLSIGATVVTGFFISKFWIFKKMTKQGELA